MDYLQLKYSVERLTECLKVLPKEDKKPLQDLILKYKNQLKSIVYIDESNTFFDKNELRQIERFLCEFRKRKIKPFQNKVYEIEEKISIDCGYEQAMNKLNNVCERLNKIAGYYAHRYNKNEWHYFKELQIKSKVYKKALSEENRKCDVLWRLCSESEELKGAEKKLENIKNVLNTFDIDLPLKNLIAYRSRNINPIQTSVDAVIRESIQLEVEKQGIEFLKTFNV